MTRVRGLKRHRQRILWGDERKWSGRVRCKVSSTALAEPSCLEILSASWKTTYVGVDERSKVH